MIRHLNINNSEQLKILSLGNNELINESDFIALLLTTCIHIPLYKPLDTLFFLVDR